MILGLLRFVLTQWFGRNLQKLSGCVFRYRKPLVGLGLFSLLLYVCYTLLGTTTQTLVWGKQVYEIGTNLVGMTVYLTTGVVLGAVCFQPSTHEVVSEHLSELRQRQTLQAELYLQQEKTKQLQAKVETLETALQKTLKHR
jgi:hypothetical protein